MNKCDLLREFSISRRRIIYSRTPLSQIARSGIKQLFIPFFSRRDPNHLSLSKDDSSRSRPNTGRRDPNYLSLSKDDSSHSRPNTGRRDPNYTGAGLVGAVLEDLPVHTGKKVVQDANASHFSISDAVTTGISSWVNSYHRRRRACFHA